MNELDINVSIATEIIGWKILSHWEPGVIKHCIDENQHEKSGIDIPLYSTDIEAAWQVVEKMYEKGFGFCIERAHNAKKWTVHFIPSAPQSGGEDGMIYFIEDMEKISDEAESLPHAICLAALKVISM